MTDKERELLLAVAEVAEIVLLDRPAFRPKRRAISELVARVKAESKIYDDEKDGCGG